MGERLLEREHLRRHRREDEVEEQAAKQTPDHALLTLQRAAGNRAVARLLQREPETKKEKKEKSIYSRVAVSTGKVLYEGKCDADLSAPSVDVQWSRGLMGKDRNITFECGPQSFRFHSFRPWFDDKGFPWDIEAADGSPGGWVLKPIEAALEDINDDYENAGSKFWNGYHTIRDALKADIHEYCSD